MSTILERIVQLKTREVRLAVERMPLAELKEIAATQDVRDFTAALHAKNSDGLPGVIAEVKKASPALGILRPDFEPESIARSYERAGAACLSVLTDRSFFCGSASDLRAARSATRLPVLRKDFIVDVYQIWEARAMGADCILLIAAMLDVQAMTEFEAVASELGMAVIVEVHNAAELEKGLVLKTPLIGVNNRNLATFETSIATTTAIRHLIPDDRTVISESGIRSRHDVEELGSIGVDNFLVGEALIRAEDPGAALERMFF
ncbi:indole-3-glycerol phosphate synthase TrpC [Caballeronia sp. GACF5]|jgi:indole-3-glycerol phosphate synthase|uniref:indole-3-glycerol phosphate synthase TrpC n=1 Tax=Caballeronia sp. GACF5 TaxID=2921746 RepID=UPI0020283315|nr:indole-3-glycerol phosphate synthase TrpC [Caballeronia sp. GACF5]